MDDIGATLERVYHLADVESSHPIRRAVDEIRRLRATLDAAEREQDSLRALLAEARNALWDMCRPCDLPLVELIDAVLAEGKR